jgi:hypothetical protein
VCLQISVEKAKACLAEAIKAFGTAENKGESTFYFDGNTSSMRAASSDQRECAYLLTYLRFKLQLPSSALSRRLPATRARK